MSQVLRLGVIAAIFALPLYPKISLMPVSGTYIPIRIDDLIIAVLAALWVTWLLRTRRRPHLPRMITVLALTWVAASFASLIVGAFVLHTISPLTGLAYWAKPVEYLLLGAIVYDLVRSGLVSTRHVLVTAAAAASVVIGYGLLEYLGLVGHMPGTSPPAGSVTSTIGDMHELAGYLGIVALFAVTVVHLVDQRPLKLSIGVALIVLAVLAYVTGARSEFLALGLLLLLLLAWRPARAPAFVVGTALAVMLVMPFVPFILASIAPAASAPGPAQPAAPSGEQPPGVALPGYSVTERLINASFGLSLNERLGKWRDYVDRAMASPIVGLGPSAATEAADGYYIRSFVESGALGLASFVALIGGVFVSLARAARDRDRLVRSLAIGGMCATAFVALVSILIDTWVASRVMELYWPLVGVTLATAALQTSASVVSRSISGRQPVMDASRA